MNKLIDFSLENAIDREIFLERKEKMQNPMKSDASFKYYIYLVAKSKAFNIEI